MILYDTQLHQDDKTHFSDWLHTCRQIQVFVTSYSIKIKNLLILGSTLCLRRDDLSMYLPLKPQPVNLTFMFMYRLNKQI